MTTSSKVIITQIDEFCNSLYKKSQTISIAIFWFLAIHRLENISHIITGIAFQRFRWCSAGDDFFLFYAIFNSSLIFTTFLNYLKSPLNAVYWLDTKQIVESNVFEVSNISSHFAIIYYNTFGILCNSVIDEYLHICYDNIT